ncbi:hypothetical protein [uncultured Polaribacter sp.]|uniref:hypothetical protein n=1 Tax=uncultured Polaribacter sp. TaxID=174711 RepID=UPI00262D6E6F|nr:hypothetical protein [uncultured Polaribacter sp.]
MKKIIILLILLFAFKTYSQNYSINNLKGKELKNSIRLNYILIDQPDITYNYGDGSTYTLDPKMGLFGLNYNIPLTDWLYTGAGFHGAVYGDQGGLFTLGVNLGVNKKIYKNLYFDANIHFGGGGGFRSLVNGGGIIYPNIGLQYKTDKFAFGLQYGHVNFFTGIQKGDNISFFVEIPTTVRSASYKNAQERFEVENTFNDTYWQKPAVKSVQQITFDYLFPVGSTRNDGFGNFNNTTPISQTLSLIGFEYQRYLTESSFAYAHLDAMYGGLRAGFMDVFIGLGKNFVQTKHINLFAKAGIGAAGGRIFPEGGLTVYPSIGADVKITKTIGVSLHGGYHRSVGGTFEAYTAGFSLKYYGLSGGIKNPYSKEKIKSIKTQGIQIGFQNQTYYDVAILDRPDNDLQLLAVKINYDLSKRFYVAGEASFAYLGGAGGYAHGIFGLGVKSNRFLNDKFSLFAEAAGGVAGGGGVDSGEGVLIRPTIGVNYHVSKDFSFHASGGQMWSPYGNVNSTNINVGISYGLSILNSKK